MVYFCPMVCEINEDSVKMFRNNQVIEVEKTKFEDVNEIALGEYFQYNEECEDYSHIDWKRFKPQIQKEFFVKEGIFHTKVLAFAPNEAFLDTNGLSQFRNTAYCHELRLLNDPNNRFFEFLNSKVGLATVKYAPTSETLFEVVEVEEVPEVYKEELRAMDLVISNAPWNVIQHQQFTQETAKLPEESLRFFPNKSISNTYSFTGVCIGEYVKANGTILHNVYDPNLGVVSAKNSRIKVGDWFTFIVNDIRNGKDKRKEYCNLDHYAAASVVWVMHPSVNAQHPTRVIEREFYGKSVQCPVFTISFLFNPEMFESPRNALISNWKKRSWGLKNDAHFWCAALGKMTIDWVKSREIIQRIEASRELAGQDSKNEPIAVEVDVMPYPAFVSMSRKDPHAALFYVEKVVRIIEFGGKIID